MILATVGASLEVEASSKTSRFRASGGRISSYIQNIEKAAATIKQNMSRRSYRRRDSRRTTTRKTSIRKSTSRYTARPSTRRIYSTTSNIKNSIQVVEKQEDLKLFSASKIPFNILLPNTFVLLEDNLDRSTGSLKLRQGNAIVKIQATEDRCEGGDTFIRSCLQAKSDSYLKEFKKELPFLELNKNEGVSLDPNTVQLTSKNRGWFVGLNSLNYKAGQLTFFDPINNFVWLMRITSAGTGKTILDDNKVLYQVFSSLLEINSTNEKIPQKITNTTTNKKSTVGVAPRTKNPITFGSDQILTFEAEKIPFSVELPKDFVLISDNLDWSEGTARFESEEGLVEITATSTVCSDQTPRLKRRCMETTAGKFAIETKKEFPKGNILQDSNMQIQLEDIANANNNSRQTSMSKSHLGRLFVMRMEGKRVGVFTFVEPNNSFVWKIKIEVPEGLDYFLNDVRQKKKTFSSLLFKAVDVE